LGLPDFSSPPSRQIFQLVVVLAFLLTEDHFPILEAMDCIDDIAVIPVVLKPFLALHDSLLVEAV
jgi:hypothetical protein